MAHARPPAVERLAVIGCGLMGGSFALALRKACPVGRIVGFSRSPASALRARELGVVDEVATDAATAVTGADLILLSVPVASTGEALAAMREAIRPDALCMDVGSTKADVMAAATRALGPRIDTFVGAHPIAGKERAGVEHADATLYDGCRVILTPTVQTDPERLARADALWRSLGARVSTLGPEEHDAALAAVSHLPHLLAFAAFRAVATQDDAQSLLSLAGPGFRDFTRIAAGDPALWRDVLIANREQVLDQARRFRAELQTMESALSAGDAQAVESLIAMASAGRSRWRLGG